MPTLALIDCSLSMNRKIQGRPDLTYKSLAASGLRFFFEKLSSRSKLEYSALVAFSSLWENVVPFTRDFQSILKGIDGLEAYDKTCLATGLQGVDTIVLEEWGAFVPVNVILVTDCRAGSGAGSLQYFLDEKDKFQFSFPCFLSIVLLGQTNTDNEELASFQKLIEVNNGLGEIIMPDGALTNQSIQNCFLQILTSHYEVYEAKLTCGNLSSLITLSPTPNFKNTISTLLLQYVKGKQDDLKHLTLSDELPIIGFLDIADANSPPFVSRHLVSPVAEQIENDGDIISPTTENEGKSPSFCVMLHGSLKIERMMAIVALGPGWFGSLCSWSDNKKKSSLILSVYDPSAKFPWLGNLNQLGPAADLTVNPYKFDEQENVEETPFPVLPSRRRSYHNQQHVVWVKNSGLQSDIHKVLRYARKLPDKTSAFYKEINRIRRAATCYFFLSLLTALAEALDKEAKTASTEAANQLRHAAEGLRNAPKRDINKNIMPL